MIDALDGRQWTVLQGDCRELLRGIAAESVHCVVTSPPYWGLRDYGLPPLVWGGDEGCVHTWGEEALRQHDSWKHGPDAMNDGRHRDPRAEGRIERTTASQGAFCRHCHAWRGSLGLEPTPELYISHMVEVFREVWRVMRKDATLFVNMGDSYASGARGPNMGNEGGLGSRQGKEGYAHQSNRNMRGHPVLKPKDLCGMPWRLAFALQADGWWLRSEIIWAKPNPMPESVRDRPTKAHETVFLLTKAARYFYDADAIREPIKPSTISKGGYGPDGKSTWPENRAITASDRNVSALSGNMKPGRRVSINPAGRNRRSVWTIPTSPFPGSHFATFPPRLIEPMILTSPTRCCAVCGKGWERVTEREFVPQEDISAERGVRCSPGQKPMDDSNSWGGSRRGSNAVATLGFRPACDCPGLDGDGPWVDCAAHPDGEANWPTVPAVVLDIFCGSGTTPMVALRHSRNAIGLELSKTYAAMARRRIVADSPLFNHPGGRHDN